mgnify:CR=1 FL=1
MENTIDTIYDRRSVRKYLDKPVNPDLVDEILRAGMFAPSGCNKQPWHFVVFDEKQLVLEIESMAKGFYQVDCSAAIENMLLAARALGLDTCWMGVYPWEEVMEKFSKRFDLPSHVKPFALISLGYAQSRQERPKRYDSSRIHYNKW